MIWGYHYCWKHLYLLYTLSKKNPTTSTCKLKNWGCPGPGGRRGMFFGLLGWEFSGPTPKWKICCARQIGSWNPKLGGENKKYLSCHHLGPSNFPGGVNQAVLSVEKQGQCVQYLELKNPLWENSNDFGKTQTLQHSTKKKQQEKQLQKILSSLGMFGWTIYLPELK